MDEFAGLQAWNMGAGVGGLSLRESKDAFRRVCLPCDIVKAGIMRSGNFAFETVALRIENARDGAFIP
jgi:hypothetical protein